MGIGEGEVPTRRSGPQTARAGIYDLLECEPARFCATREGGLEEKIKKKKKTYGVRLYRLEGLAGSG